MAIAFAGAGLFASIGAPAPWLAGAMLATALAALMGLPLILPIPVRNAGFVILGLQIGASFTPESLASVAQWPVSLAILVLTMAVLVAAGQQLLTRAFGWDRTTAYFACMPGALSLALAMAEDYGADVRRVATVQSMRLFLLIALLPFVAVEISGESLPTLAVGTTTTPLVTVVLLSVGAGAGYLFHRLGAPAGFMLGAMSANACLHLFEIAEGGVPAFLVIPAFVMLGTMVGVRFREITLKLLANIAAAGLASFVLALTIAATGAVLAATVTDIPVMATVLAFAPGGLEVMTILALALGVNPAFVATHQIIRYLSLVMSMPLATKSTLQGDDK